MKGNIFIKRPVMAISISVLILAIGLISLFTLPVEQYPDIAPPTVYVAASYTGADAEAVMNSVIMPLEESINGVEDMMYITSSASNAGLAIIQVYFKQGTDPDMAAVNVQNRVAKAQGLLPAEVTKVGVSTMKRQTSFLQIGAMVCTDGRYDQTFLANYLDINVIPQIKRIEGVGDVMELGDTYSMRIWLKPERMAQYGLVPSDITGVLGEQNIEAPTGSLGESSQNVFQFTMKYRGRLKSVEEFQNTVVRSREDGSILRLKDVADVELGTMTYSFRSEMDSQPAVLYMIFQTAGSNATAVNKEITAQMERMEKNLPEGTEFVTMMSSNDFLFASIHNVVETLIIAIILVILVVYFFLQDLKSTLIPSISIIVSLVGTFACLVAAGFSLNILTLFALVLAIGTVVDDAIVVVEAVQSKFDAGYKSPYLATKDAMGDVTMAIVSCTCVFMAVFIPVTFMGGTSGVFYTQFGITMATAVGISMISALTLCPALCAIMMRPSDGTKSAKSINGRVRAAYNASFNAVLGKYKKGGDVLHPPSLDGMDFTGCYHRPAGLSNEHDQDGTRAAGRPGRYHGECQHLTGKHARRDNESNGPAGKHSERYARNRTLRPRSRIRSDLRSGNILRYDHCPPERLERTKRKGTRFGCRSFPPQRTIPVHQGSADIQLPARHDSGIRYG